MSPYIWYWSVQRPSCTTSLFRIPFFPFPYLCFHFFFLFRCVSSQRTIFIPGMRDGPSLPHFQYLCTLTHLRPPPPWRRMWSIEYNGVRACDQILISYSWWKTFAPLTKSNFLLVSVRVRMTNDSKTYAIRIAEVLVV